MQVYKVQFQLVPDIAVKFKPVGIISTTLTSPEVALAPWALLTVMVYVAPAWPCVKLPLCVTVAVNTGGFPGAQPIEDPLLVAQAFLRLLELAAVQVLDLLEAPVFGVRVHEQIPSR